MSARRTARVKNHGCVYNGENPGPDQVNFASFTLFVGSADYRNPARQLPQTGGKSDTGGYTGYADQVVSTAMPDFRKGIVFRTVSDVKAFPPTACHKGCLQTSDTPLNFKIMSFKICSDQAGGKKLPATQFRLAVNFPGNIDQILFFAFDYIVNSLKIIHKVYLHSFI